MTVNRRSFLKWSAAGALFTGAPLTLPLQLAANARQETSILPSRWNAKPFVLHYNENSLGMSSSAKIAAQRALNTESNKYPDKAINELQEAIADHHGVPKNWIILGNGSGEVLRAIVLEAARLNAEIVEPTPTFGAIKRTAADLGLRHHAVPVNNDFTTNLNKIEETISNIAGPALINLCNPNNPTGTITEENTLFGFINRTNEKHLILVDEAYYDYASDEAYKSALELLHQGRENLIVTRTFSKVYGMAGMRIGYGIAREETAKRILQHASPYNLNIVGIRAAIASLRDTGFYRHSVNSNQKSKEILYKALEELQLPYIKSHTNFVLHQINSTHADYQQHMKDNRVLVGRKMTQKDNWNRLSLGTPDEMLIFVKLLTEFRNKGWV